MNKRLLLPALIALLLFMDSTRSVVIGALSDAFLSSYCVCCSNLAYLLLPCRQTTAAKPQLPKSTIRHLEIIMASFMGALPGCGGAIIVVTQFTKGQASFAAVVAVLTATMGDAAFLLMAKSPTTALQIISWVFSLVALVASWFAFSRAQLLCPAGDVEHQAHTQAIPKAVILSRSVWKLFLAPSVVIALAIAFNSDFGAFKTP